MAEMSQNRINQLNTKRLADVRSELAVKVFKMIDLARAAGFDLLVTCGYRSEVEQNRLYAQGRTRPGKIVTNARGGQSNHQKRVAADLVLVKDGDLIWDATKYRGTIGQWAAAVGLNWGGNWKKFKDYPHVEL